MMAEGIEIYNADGSLQFAATDRVFRVLTIRAVGTSNGAVSNSAIGTNNTLTYVAKSNASREQPTVSVSNGQVAWSWGSTPTASRDGDAMLQIVLY